MRTGEVGASPLTTALERASINVDAGGIGDLLFLELWEAGLVTCPGALLRIRQIRRANPDLAAETRAELARGASPAHGKIGTRVSAAVQPPPNGGGSVLDLCPREQTANGSGATGGR